MPNHRNLRPCGCTIPTNPTGRGSILAHHRKLKYTKSSWLLVFYRTLRVSLRSVGLGVAMFVYTGLSEYHTLVVSVQLNSTFQLSEFSICKIIMKYIIGSFIIFSVFKVSQTPIKTRYSFKKNCLNCLYFGDIFVLWR